MRTETIRSFLKLVEVGSYAAAAESLYMNATTLHGQVKSLEEELGAPLITFEGRRLALTRAGAQFLVFAERTLAEYDDLRDKLHGLPRLTQTTLRVVSLPSPGIHLLPPVVRRFQDERPDVQVSVDTRFTDEALAALVSRQADLAIIHDAHAEHARDVFETAVVYVDPLVAVVRAGLYRPPDADLLSRYPLAVQPPPNLSRTYVERWARAQNIDIRPAFEHISFGGILNYVLDADCVGIVGGYTVTTSTVKELVRVLDLPGFEQIRRMVALFPASAGAAVRQFVACFQSFYADGAAARGRRA